VPASAAWSPVAYLAKIINKIPPEVKKKMQINASPTTPATEFGEVLSVGKKSHTMLWTGFAFIRTTILLGRPSRRTPQVDFKCLKFRIAEQKICRGATGYDGGCLDALEAAITDLPGIGQLTYDTQEW
jgi:hypothetical protein